MVEARQDGFKTGEMAIGEDDMAGTRSHWWHVIADERAAIQEGPAPRVSAPVAVGVTAGVVIVGNALVVLQRRVGGTFGESLTAIVVPLLGAAGSVVLIAAGWRRRDLGLAFHPRSDLADLRRPASALAGPLCAASIATLLRGGRHDGISEGLTVVRVVVGTALGEELIHRGVLFALWSATGASTKTVAVANAVAFGAWHIMAATSETWHPRSARIVVPAVAGTALFLWARARSGSVFGSSLLHATTNLPFVLLRPVVAAFVIRRPSSSAVQTGSRGTASRRSVRMSLTWTGDLEPSAR